MKTVKLLIVGALITSCGQEAEPKNTEADAIDYDDPEQEEVVVEYRKDGDILTITVDETRSLPPCEHANSAQRAWVKSDDKFFVCSDLLWIEEVKAFNPATDGPDHTDEPKAALGLNEWVDPVTERIWMVSSPTTATLLQAFPPCASEYALGSIQEVRAASQHGLSLYSVQIGSLPALWTNEVEEQVQPTAEDGTISTLYVRWVVAETGAKSLTVETAGVACLKDVP